MSLNADSIWNYMISFMSALEIYTHSNLFHSHTWQSFTYHLTSPKGYTFTSWLCSTRNWDLAWWVGCLASFSIALYMSRIEEQCVWFGNYMATSGSIRKSAEIFIPRKFWWNVKHFTKHMIFDMLLLLHPSIHSYHSRNLIPKK